MNSFLRKLYNSIGVRLYYRFPELRNYLPDKLYLQCYWKERMPDFASINLDNPSTFGDKINWLKLYYHNPIQHRIVDKYEFKSYVLKKMGEPMTAKTLGVYNSFEEIKFDELPNKFVLKCTHDSGSYWICRDKSTFNKEEAKKKICACMNVRDYYYRNREWPYKGIKPRIIAEEFLSNDEDCLVDYKFFCFNGEPKVMYISKDSANDVRTDFYDMEFNHLDLRIRDKNSDFPIEKPSFFDEMKRISSIMSGDFPHVRVDFYYVNGKIYIGEMTFFHNGGFCNFKPREWDKIWGDWLSLPKK